MLFFGQKTKVRFAPSPTGFLHIGGLRTALYNYLFAKKNKGKFILRIEDTDRERTVEGGIENIIKTLKTCGLKYDEGPNIGGKNKPYIQSERLPIYKHYVEELIEKNSAYYCFCSPLKLAKEREEQKAKGMPTKYSGDCRNLTKDQCKQYIKKKMPYVVRLKIPEKGTTEFEDLVYGKIKMENHLLDDQILLKSDGYPTYHLANVVDDHLMGISHVIRGEEWLPSTPKHIILYDAFEWALPNFAHLPLLLNPDKSKLSKRQGDVAVEDYLKKGFLPEALINFVALLGWNPKGDQEIYEIKELIKYFDIKSVNKGGAIFNQEKLLWMNGEYIKKKPIKELAELCIPYLIEAELIEKSEKKYKVKKTGEKISKEWLLKVVALEQERMKRLDEIAPLTEFLFKDNLDYSKEDLIWKKSDKKETKKILRQLINFLEELKEKNFKKENLEREVTLWLKKEDIKTGNALWPMRVALSGKRNSPGPFEIADVLEKGKTLKRLRMALKKL